MKEAIEFETLKGPFVLAFTGEGRICCVLQTAADVVKVMMHDHGMGWGIDGTRESLLEQLEDDDNWVRDEDRKLFEFGMDIGETASVRITRIHETAFDDILAEAPSIVEAA